MCMRKKKKIEFCYKTETKVKWGPLKVKERTVKRILVLKMPDNTFVNLKIIYSLFFSLLGYKEYKIL